MGRGAGQIRQILLSGPWHRRLTLRRQAFFRAINPTEKFTDTRPCFARLRRDNALIPPKNVLYDLYEPGAHDRTVFVAALPLGASFFGDLSQRSWNKEGVKSTRQAVAGKARQKSKKASAGAGRGAKTKKSAAPRRAPHASRGATRGGAPAAKTAGPHKGAGEGVLPGMSSNKKTTQRQGFKTNEFIVYPAHGVGQIMAIEEQEVAGIKLELFVINFVKDKMT